MSPGDFKCQRMSRNEARKLIARLALSESVTFVSHAFDRMKERNVSLQDAWNVLESPDSFIHGDGEFENGSYRYRLCTNRIQAVLSFNSDGTRLIVVTVIRRSI